MKIKVLKSKKTKFPSYYTPVMIMVKGEESKGEQAKTLKVRFSKEAEKKLPADFKGGIIEMKGSDINYPFVYEIKKTEEGKDDYPFVYVKDIESVAPLKPRENTCSFVGVEEDTEETEIASEGTEEDETINVLDENGDPLPL